MDGDTGRRDLGRVRTQRQSVVEAGYQGEDELVDRALTDPAPGQRVLALGALNRLGRLNARHLAGAAGDSAAPVRRRAAELAAGGHLAVALSLLDDHDPTVAETAAWAIGELPAGPESVHRLVAMVRDHDDALCREAAVAALGALGDEAGLDAILRATSDKATVRRRAVIALAPFSGPAVETALTAALDDRDWQVRQAAEDLLD